jgi:hypothetical protein
VPRLGLRPNLGLPLVPRRETWGSALLEWLAVPVATLELTPARAPPNGSGTQTSSGGSDTLAEDLDGRRLAPSGSARDRVGATRVSQHA